MIGPEFPVYPEFRYEASMPGADQLDPLLATKLWRNPCWLSFRIDNLALHFNGAVYDWTEKRFGLSRPEFVVLYSVGLQDGIAATDIARSSGFPRNTLSRATQKLLERKLMRRELDPTDLRSYVLRLTPAGRRVFDEAQPVMVEREEIMLQSLSPAEKHTLYELLAKMVVDSPNWPASIRVKRGAKTQEDDEA